MFRVTGSKSRSRARTASARLACWPLQVEPLVVAVLGLGLSADLAGELRGGLATTQSHRPARFRLGPPARRTTLWLGVALEGIRDLVVDDEARVALVDAHAEGLGRDHDAVPTVHEGVLSDVADLGMELPVVQPNRQVCFDPPRVQS